MTSCSIIGKSTVDKCSSEHAVLRLAWRAQQPEIRDPGSDVERMRESLRLVADPHGLRSTTAQNNRRLVAKLA